LPEKLREKGIDKSFGLRYSVENRITEKTIEAEITVIMLFQRVRGAERRAENRSSNGPLRARGKA